MKKLVMSDTEPVAQTGPLVTRDAQRSVLISDFDGTMTRFDFYQLAIEKLLPPETPNYWEGYRSGATTHFEALRTYFADIHGSEAEVRDVVREMELDPLLPRAVADLHRAGWSVIVVSAGCEWYIRQLLDAVGVEIPIHANPGHLEPGRGLVMEKPVDSPFLSETLGVDKGAVVRHYNSQGCQVAFAGDGYPDAEPARLVPDRYRFARGDLARVLEREHVGFHFFETWSDIPRQLLH